jgi:SAM-dependent methyltransferase
MTQPDENASSRYDTTRRAWQNIWDSASVEVELETVRYNRSMETIQLYAPYLPKDAVILEAGSGLSAVVLTLRDMGYTVVGMDYAENALHTSRAYDSTLNLFAGDVHKLPVADASVGAYLSFGVLEHFEHGMGPALAEAYRALRPGGTLILTIPYPNVVNKLVALRRRLSGRSLLTDDTFFESTYDRPRLVSEVMHAGFEVRKVAPTSHAYTFWGLGGPFQAPGYYRTSTLAEALGELTARLLPWPFNFTTLVIARKPE